MVAFTAVARGVDEDDGEACGGYAAGIGMAFARCSAAVQRCNERSAGRQRPRTCAVVLSGR